MITAANIQTVDPETLADFESELATLARMDGIKYRIGAEREYGWTMKVDNLLFWIADDGPIQGSTTLTVYLDGDGNAAD